MKKAFRHIRLGPEKLHIIEHADRVMQAFGAMGYKLTLRQLYYQFISKKLLPDSWIDREYNLREGLAPDTKNTEKNYKKLGDIIADGRWAGHLDWELIEDRGRQPERHAQWSGLDSLVDAALASYRLDRWVDQPCYVELWWEKDALSGVLQSVADEFHIYGQANKGYASVSAIYEASKRFRAGCGELASPFSKHPSVKRPGFIFYMGDHDPSGLDMGRDIFDRMYEFLGWNPAPMVEGNSIRRFNLIRLALTMDQVQEFDLPPDPAKVSDSRAKNYMAEYGDESWELDALTPDTLVTVATDGLEQLVDRKKMAKVIKQEDKDKSRLRKALEKL